MKDRRYGIQKLWGGAATKVFEARFLSTTIGTGKTRYEAEQLIAKHKKERTVTA